jgi:DNA processing protein
MKAEPENATIALLALMKLKGVGRRAALKLVDGADPSSDRQRIEERYLQWLSRSPNVPNQASELLTAWLKSAEQIQKGEREGIRAISLYDEDYPDRLKQTPDPPAVLFVKGSAGALHAKSTVAVVGTREPTPYGSEVAKRTGRTAAEAGFVVVSGLAHGCDTLAHEGCVEANGSGIAVLAHGLEQVYPAASRGLAGRLLDSGGCLVSEYPYGLKPARSAFAERDRIQSGLSDGVVVVETDVRGGTMHTVNFARAQHRYLACVAHPAKWLSCEKTRGNQKLIHDRWAEPLADGAALTKFLGKLQQDDHSSEPAKPVADYEVQGSLAF